MTSQLAAAALTGALDAVLEVTRAHHLEGIVAKRVDAPYEPGRRSGSWLKHKHRRLETFAVTGWRPAPHRASRPDAIFVARADPDGHLRPAGTAELASQRTNASDSEPRFNSDTSGRAAARTASPAAFGSTSTSTAQRLNRSATQSCARCALTDDLPGSLGCALLLSGLLL
jgi:ATP-dependent DNA ligase